MRAFPVVAALCLVACGDPPSSAPSVEQDTADLTGTSGTHKHARHYFHYSPSISGVEWRPGCGVPTDPPCYVGVELTFTAPFSDLQTAVTSRLDESTRTLTLIVDSFSTSANHPRTAVHEESRQLGQDGLQFGGSPYTVNVLDYRHAQLWTGSITPALAP
jgi:hypothetical protein